MAKTPTLNVREVSDSHGGVLSRIPGPRRIPVSSTDGSKLDWLTIDEVGAEGPPGPAGEGSPALKDPVYDYSEDPITLSGDGGVGAPDGVRWAALGQTGGVDAGIYITDTGGPWTRAGDWDTGAEIPSGCVFQATNRQARITLIAGDPFTVGLSPALFTVEPFQDISGDTDVVVAVEEGALVRGKIQNAYFAPQSINLSILNAAGTDGQVVKRSGGVLALVDDTGAIPDGKVTVATTAVTTIGSISTIPRSKSFTLRMFASQKESGGTYHFEHAISGVSDGSGVITLEPYDVLKDPLTGTAFAYTTGTDTVNVRVYQVTATSADWRVRFTLEQTA